MSIIFIIRRVFNLLHGEYNKLKADINTPRTPCSGLINSFSHLTRSYCLLTIVLPQDGWEGLKRKLF